MKRAVPAVALAIAWTLVVVFRERAVWLWLLLALLAYMLLKPRQRIYAMLLAIFGGLLDSLWAVSGLIQFNGDGLLPLWMMALWIMFACVWVRLTAKTTLSIWGLALMASLGGPLAYFIGERLGAMVFLAPSSLVLSGMALGWGVLMLCFHSLIGRYG